MLLLGRLAASEGSQLNYILPISIYIGKPSAKMTNSERLRFALKWKKDDEAVSQH